jgi:hypothetical protein
MTVKLKFIEIININFLWDKFKYYQIYTTYRYYKCF